jgi:hypothetical protein
VCLNSAVFNTENHKSHAGGVVAFLSSGFVANDATATNLQSTENITYPPTKEVFVTCIQTVVTKTPTTRIYTERALVRERVKSASSSNGLTVSDISYHLNRELGTSGIDEIITHVGANSYVEIPSVTVREED